MSNLDFYTQNYIQNGVNVRESLAEAEKSKRKDNLFYLAISFFALTFIMVVMILNTYVFFIAVVDGSSMVPTLTDGDKLFANRHKDFEVDDIVTIKVGNELWIKRVIATGGQTVEIKDGYVYVDGLKKDEPYIKNQAITFLKDENGSVDKQKTYSYTLKENEIYFLGDNRESSKDARAVGVCEEGDVVGVIEYWSLWFNNLKK